MKTLLLAFLVWIKGEDLEEKPLQETKQTHLHRRHRVLAHAKNKYKSCDSE
jgi:hypothetical protein